MRRVHETTVTVEKQHVLRILSACCSVIQHAPYWIVICGLYFSTLSPKLHDFLKKKDVVYKKCVLKFSVKFVCKIYDSKNILSRYSHK